ncbi:DinB family protein [Sutcliffiella rhizosphaerae]|uniref:DinB-like domain-containing protein n=1 Tax=Sutcliffiella rhizosphaerae TaxID=2880967 RepID=A0ABM8YKH0_9BACI|nr:DinB family protein [Sutcliffiella rhizosphaerae]CAG9620450.1 hypothetical protein BACCIP111883_01218 [Sutcliffiella rhizosphaerae]
MNFKLVEAVSMLERTPRVLNEMLTGLPEGFLTCNEGEGTWSGIEVVDHLIEAEKENWIPRLRFIVEVGDTNPFPEFDRFAHLHEKAETTLAEKLNEFKKRREDNLETLKSLVDEDILDRKGFHPALGEVKLKELIATWAVHDLTHLNQITRVIAKRYSNDVGPWKEYLGILKREL